MLHDTKIICILRLTRVCSHGSGVLYKVCMRLLVCWVGVLRDFGTVDCFEGHDIGSTH